MNDTQAKNGFKTFVTTLVISLVVFGSAYYILTESDSEVDIEGDSVLSGTSERATGDPENSVFGEMISNGSGHSDVLAASDIPGDIGVGTTEPTAPVVSTQESTAPVPETGSNTVYALLISFSALATAAYLYLTGPRKMALANFEKRFLDDLDK